MPDLLSSNPLIRLADRAMSLSSQRMGLIAGNLANLDTPGYRARGFDFEAALRQELGASEGQALPMFRTHPAHLTLSGNSVRAQVQALGGSARNDGNDVSLDRESMALARTQASYQLASTLAQIEVRRTLSAIREAGR